MEKYSRQTIRNNISLAANMGFAKWRVMCLYDSLVQDLAFVILVNFCAKNPPLRNTQNVGCKKY
jgi:hypothetical protein